MRALAQDRDAARLMGVDADRTAMLGFGIGAALAGLAGGLLVTIQGVNAGVGTAISIKAFIMIMIGGAGVVGGAILGAIVLGFAEFDRLCAPARLHHLPADLHRPHHFPGDSATRHHGPPLGDAG